MMLIYVSIYVDLDKLQTMWREDAKIDDIELVKKHLMLLTYMLNISQF